MQTNILENLFLSSEKFPDQTAVIDEVSEISYVDLRDDVISVGTSLQNILPEGQQTSVIIFIDKSIDCLKAMFGTLYSGHYYVPVDIQTPEDRFQEIVSQLDNQFLITTKKLADKVADLDYQGQIFILSDLEAAGQSAEQDQADPAAPWTKRIDTDLAYVLFTSGSTGAPKGVAVTHRSLIDYVDAYLSVIDVDETDIWGNQSPFCFDISLKDIYVSQKVGSTLCILPNRYFSTPKKLLQYLDEKQVTILTWVPTAYRIVVRFHGLEKVHPSSLRKFIFSGEIMPAAVYNYWKAAYPDAAFIQLYGPTEITGACTYYKVNRSFAEEEMIPIGQAFPNTDVFLLDEENKNIPSTSANCVGEICVRGSCLAVGYMNDQEKTEDAFVQNPLQCRYPEKVYRTGDLACWNEEQELVFVSRKDSQIKHSGHRIELGEVENGILAIDGIDGVCCVQDREKDEIVCFYAGADFEKKDLMILAQKKLPKYMLPTTYYRLEELPVLANGKVDRKSLDTEVNTGNTGE